MSCSSVSPSHVAQSLRNRLLQPGSLTESHILPGNLLRCGLFSLWGFPWVTASFGHPVVPARAPPGGAVDLCTPVPSMGCRGTGEYWNSSCPSFLPALSVCRAVLSHILTLLYSGCNCFCPITFFPPKYVIQDATTIPDWPSLGWWWDHPGFGGIGSAGHEEPSSTFSENPSLYPTPPQYQNLAIQTEYAGLMRLTVTSDCLFDFAF